ncbi:MAG TPA: 3-oxoacyl-ACP reductase family protein [Burkholderiales bacterium]|nr:3-oxoacyl-ACP reductase family protein [Burkholderiales bacterium]
MSRLPGKVAIVTGGTRGIGLAIVRGFLREGAQVVFSGTSAHSVDRARVALPADAACEGVAVDLTDPARGALLLERATARFGGVDVLVNNAGVLSRKDEWDTTPEDWDYVMGVNLKTVFFLSREAAHAMRTRGGSIVNIASVAGQIGGIAGSPAYSAAKAGVLGLTKSLARRFAPLKIRVNAISPADIETDMTASFTPEIRARLIGMTPLGRFGGVEEVVGAAVYFAADESSYVTGQTLAVNGGLFMA